jgi:hypothetical protein
MESYMSRRAASLLAASGMAAGMLFVGVCLVGLFSSYTGESDASAVLAVVRVARSEHVASGGHRHPIGRAAPTALGEETETKEGLPANAGLLTALLLLSYFAMIPVGLSSTSLVVPGPMVSRSTQCRLYSAVCFFQRRSPSTLSGVFRL